MKEIKATQAFEINPWPSLADAVFSMMTCLILVIMILVISNKETVQKIVESQTKKQVYKEIIQELPDVPIEEREDRIIITFPDRVLFDSGSADLKETGKPELWRVGKAIGFFARKKQIRTVQVEGHTDDQPIASAKYPTNWELSTTRATNVVRYLVDQVQLDPHVLSAAGLAYFRPVDTNETPEGRQRNRRIEIALFAK